MAVVTIKSLTITDQDASPRVSSQSGKGAGFRAKEFDAFAQATNGDSAASKYILFRVPSSIRVKDVILEAEARGAACTVNYGWYFASRVEDIGAGQVAGAVINASFHAAAVAQTAAILPTNIVNAAGGTYTVDKRSQPLWQALGLATDPGGKFDFVATVAVAVAATGKIYAKVGVAE